MTFVQYSSYTGLMLQSIAAKYRQVQWVVMDGNDLQMGGVDWQLSGSSLEVKLAVLALFYIGLMSLPPKDWARGKSGEKVRAYIAAGLVPVMADIGYSRERVRHAETSFFCGTYKDQGRHLGQATENADLCQNVAPSAAREVEQRFDPAAIVTDIGKLLARLVVYAKTR